MVVLGGKTATGLQVSDDVVAALGTGKRPAVRVTVGGHMTVPKTSHDVLSRGRRFDTLFGTASAGVAPYRAGRVVIDRLGTRAESEQGRSRGGATGRRAHRKADHHSLLGGGGRPTVRAWFPTRSHDSLCVEKVTPDDSGSAPSPNW